MNRNWPSPVRKILRKSVSGADVCLRIQRKRLKKSGRVFPGIAVVEPAKPEKIYDFSHVRRPGLDWPGIGRFLVQTVVGSVVVIIIEIFMKEPIKMPFVKDDDMVQNFPSDAADESFGHAILPGRLE